MTGSFKERHAIATTLTCLQVDEVNATNRRYRVEHAEKVKACKVRAYLCLHAYPLHSC